MRSTICALLITLAAAAAIITGTRIGQDRSELLDQIATLERDIRHHQTMLDDAHRYVEHLRREVLCVDSDMSAREWMWIMADQFREAGVKVKFH
jgi:hypothetical protein